MVGVIPYTVTRNPANYTNLGFRMYGGSYEWLVYDQVPKRGGSHELYYLVKNVLIMFTSS